MPDSGPSVTIERPCLYLVATPIGNLADLGFRARQVLADADLLLAEDTRMTQRLLDHYGIARRAQALHEHNEREVASGIVRRLLEQQQAAALVSDAGTPLLSDPGFPLVQAALAAGLAVRAVPGASALLAALCVAGLPTDRFAFEGFLPPREQAARQRLDALADKDHTLVFYESPRRVLRTLALMRESMGDERACCVARELTKLHETHYRGSLADVSRALTDDPFGEAGEFVILLGPAPAAAAATGEIQRVLALLAPHVSRRTAVDLTASLLARPRNEVYALALRSQDDE